MLSCRAVVANAGIVALAAYLDGVGTGLGEDNGELTHDIRRGSQLLKLLAVLVINRDRRAHRSGLGDKGFAAVHDAHAVDGEELLGLGGCRKYHPGSFQYTDRQMRGRILKMRWPIRKAGGVDILVTHAPAEGLGDSEDVAHWGFPSLRTFLDKYSPGYHVHGHVHMTYGQNIPRLQSYNDTTIINAYERYTLEIPDREVPEKKKNKLIWINDPPEYAR